MTLTAEERSARVVCAIEATVAGDTSAVSELFTPDVVAWSPTVAVLSRVELAVEIEDHEDAFSEIEVDTGPVVSGSNRVCAEWVATATHSAPLALGDGYTASPSGHRVTLRGATVAEFDGDRICAVRHYWDEIGLLGQLGLLPDS